MSLTVRGDRVLVVPESQEVYEQPSGLVTVESYAPEVLGTVVACGDVRDVRVGDVVLFPPSAGQHLEYDETRYLVLHESEVLATWETL